MKSTYLRGTLLILVAMGSIGRAQDHSEERHDVPDHEIHHDEVHQDVPMPPAAQPAKEAPSGALTWQDSPRNKGADITTINEQQGNWFKKAQLFKKGAKAYRTLRDQLVKMQPLEEKHVQERQAIDDQLNQFYQEYGFQSGEADQHLDVLIADIKRLEDPSGALDAEEQKILTELKGKKEEVESVKKEFDELRRLDSELNRAVTLLSEQINRAVAYEEQAYDDHEQIEATVSDELAAQLLNKINNALDNVGVIALYLHKEFEPAFKKSLVAVEEYKEKVKAQIIALKEKGIALGKKMVELLEKEEAARKEQQEREHAAIKNELAKAQRSMVQKAYDWVSLWCASCWQVIYHAAESTVHFFKSFFVSETKQPVKTQEMALPLEQHTPEHQLNQSALTVVPEHHLAEQAQLPSEHMVAQPMAIPVQMPLHSEAPPQHLDTPLHGEQPQVTQPVQSRVQQPMPLQRSVMPTTQPPVVAVQQPVMPLQHPPLSEHGASVTMHP